MADVVGLQLAISKIPHLRDKNIILKSHTREEFFFWSQDNLDKTKVLTNLDEPVPATGDNDGVAAVGGETHT